MSTCESFISSSPSVPDPTQPPAKRFKRAGLFPYYPIYVYCDIEDPAVLDPELLNSGLDHYVSRKGGSCHHILTFLFVKKRTEEMVSKFPPDGRSSLFLAGKGDQSVRISMMFALMLRMGAVSTKEQTNFLLFTNNIESYGPGTKFDRRVRTALEGKGFFVDVVHLDQLHGECTSFDVGFHVDVTSLHGEDTCEITSSGPDAPLQLKRAGLIPDCHTYVYCDIEDPAVLDPKLLNSGLDHYVSSEGGNCHHILTYLFAEKRTDEMVSKFLPDGRSHLFLADQGDQSLRIDMMFAFMLRMGAVSTKEQTNFLLFTNNIESYGPGTKFDRRVRTALEGKGFFVDVVHLDQLSMESAHLAT